MTVRTAVRRFEGGLLDEARIAISDERLSELSFLTVGSPRVWGQADS